MELYVGQAGLRGDIAAYSRRFNFAELSAEPFSLPRLSRLRGYRRKVPEGFAFSVRLPRAVACLEIGASTDEVLSQALAAAEALQAEWLVIGTSAEVTPCARTVGRLADLVGRLPRSTFRVAWEPRGLWEDDQEEALARELDLVLVRDLRRRLPPFGDIGYTRFLALGAGGRQNDASLHRVLSRLSDYQRAFVVIEGSGAERARDFLRQSEA